MLRGGCLGYQSGRGHTGGWAGATNESTAGVVLMAQAARGGGRPLQGPHQEVAHAVRAWLSRDVVLLAPPDAGERRSLRPAPPLASTHAATLTLLATAKSCLVLQCLESVVADLPQSLRMPYLVLIKHSLKVVGYI